jgi:hypothetical protein
MNNQEKQTEDLLRQYIDPERIEKAPDGFTANVMTRIQMETVQGAITGRQRNKNLVPVISAFVTIILIVAAVLIPGNHSETSLNPVLELIKNIKISLPEIDFSPVFSINLPALIIYIIIGIFVLTVFDRALFGLFHREK